MKHASYLGTRPGVMGLGNRLIRGRLRGPVSHCETVFEPGDGVDALMPDGTCEPDEFGRLWGYSSVGLERLPAYSPRRAGKIGGTRFKRIDFTDTSKWELNPLRKRPLVAARLASERQGIRYDWLFIGSFASWLIQQNESRTACSEECALIAGFPEPHRFDPCSLRAAVKGIL